MSFLRTAAIAIAVSAMAQADTALLTLVSPDAKVIGGISVTRTKNSPFGQFLLNQIKEDDAGFRELVTATGFDPRRDLNEIVFASPGAGVKGQGLVLARGLFNGPQIIAAAKAKGATTVTYKNVELVQHPNALLGVVDSSLAVAGEPGMVRAAIDRLAISGLPPSSLFQKASSMSARLDAWVVSNGVAANIPAMPGRPGVPNPAFESILETSGGVLFGTVVQVEGEAITKTEADAKALVQIAQFLTGMMALNQNNNAQAQQMQTLLQSLNVQAQGTSVKLSLRIPETDLEGIVKPKRAARKTASL